MQFVLCRLTYYFTGPQAHDLCLHILLRSTPLLDAANNRLNNPETACDGGAAAPVPTSNSETSESGSSEPEQWYPEAGTCVEASGNVPDWIDVDTLSASKQECCDDHFPNVWDDGCMNGERPNNNAVPDGKPTQKPSQQPLSSLLPDSDLYYPDYGSDGTKAECVQGGDIPSWMNRNMLKSSSTECCKTYFPNNSAECDQGGDKYPYYPDFQTNKCVSNRKYPTWMAGDYLQKNQWLCCETFFSHNTDLLLNCQSR